MIYTNDTREPKKWSGIVVHCTATDQPDENTFNSIYLLHTSPSYRKFWWGNYPTTGRNYADIGYNFIIEPTGVVKEGRPLYTYGAHTMGHNSTHIGIVVCGNENFVGAQFKALNNLIDDLKERFSIKEEDIHPHNYFNKIKTCPNFDVYEIRRSWNDRFKQSKAEPSREASYQSVSEEKS